MRKKFLSISIILLLLTVVGLCLIACNKNKPDESLPVPSGISISGGVVRWRTVEEADSFELRINNVIVESFYPSFNLLKMSDLPADRQFAVRVRSVKGEERSEWSELVTYVHTPKALSAPALHVVDGRLTWTADAQASKVVVYVNGNATELPAATAQFDLSTLQGDCILGVQFLGDGNYVLDSTTVTVNYKADLGLVQLNAPKNVFMKGSLLTFDAVPGADIYYILDTSGSITTSKVTSNSRANKLLVQAVWAGCTSGEFAESEKTEVTYFAEGKGTQEYPFLIGSATELRFVEYYNVTGQPKYYKFKNDVKLTEYSPQEEEIYNNFYNLGALCGVIDGDGHKLVNQVVYYPDGYSSLFDSIAPNGVIKNLVIDNANFRTWTNLTNDGVMHEKGGECAILAYTNRGKLENITVTNSSVHAEKDGAAALVAINKGEIKNCVVESSTQIYGANEAGGIAIFNSGTVTGCINRAEISGKTTVGGIVGRNNGTISQCGNEGKITATTYGGGIVGYNYNLSDDGKLMFASTVSQCYNYGAINVVSFGGGIAGRNGSDGVNEVGQTSYANAGISSCYNTGKITGANCLGGIVGDNYSYHETARDLGVVNCYNSGEISVNTAALGATRVYLSFENLSWDPTVDGAVFYMHFWGAAGESAWPGVRMTEATINGKTYYYADMSITAEQLTGVIFNRCNPNTGDVWNQTADIKGSWTTGNLLFKVNDSWEKDNPNPAANASSSTLISATPLTAGGIAGFNNMINDCYFLAGKVDNRTLMAGIAIGDRYNKIQLGGEFVSSSACEIASASALTTFSTTLNAYADVWVDSANGPVLKWQRRG